MRITSLYYILSDQIFRLDKTSQKEEKKYCNNTRDALQQNFPLNLFIFIYKSPAGITEKKIKRRRNINPGKKKERMYKIKSL
jgi:hypothetical protein